jgi:hypothetical protein
VRLVRCPFIAPNFISYWKRGKNWKGR